MKSLSEAVLAGGFGGFGGCASPSPMKVSCAYANHTDSFRASNLGNPPNPPNPPNPAFDGPLSARLAVAS